MDVSAQVPPGNDNLTNAVGIAGASGSVLGTNLYATAEINEPGPAPGITAQSTVWYSWTAPYTTPMDFNTSGSTDTNGNDLYTSLAVYTLKPGKALAVANLKAVASDAAYNTNIGEVTSRLHFQVTMGTTYYFQVDGATNANTGTNNAQGIITLNWSPSLETGTFAFSSTTYNVGANDNGFVGTSNPSISPSVNSPEGTPGAGARITVIRTGGYTGQCEVTLTMQPAFYTNEYVTNFFGQEVDETNYDGSGNIVGNTNITTITYLSENFDQNADGNFLQADAYYDVVQTNIDGTYFNPATNYPSMAGLGLQNIFTNFLTNFDLDCQVASAGPILETNSGTNIFFTNYFCSAFNPIIDFVVTPSATPGVDYTPITQTLTFSNFQMSQDVFVPVFQGVGPDAPDTNGDYTYIGISPQVTLILTNAQADPNEDPDLGPPSISTTAGTAQLNILSYLIDPNNFGNGIHTNNSTLGTLGAEGQPIPVQEGMIAVNWERSTFRVNKNTGTATVYVYLSGTPPAGSSYNVTYSVDYNPALGALNWNGFSTVAGSDFAIPANGLKDFDFGAPTSGWGGTTGSVTIGPFPTQTPWAAVSIPINNNPITEFASDIDLQLLSVSGGAFIGSVPSANLTINYNVQPSGSPQYAPPPPGGSVDVNYNADGFSGTIEANPIANPLPGANQAVQAIAMQPDGKAIIGGSFTAYDSAPIFGVARLMGPASATPGWLDTSFNPKPGTGINYLGSVDAIALDAQGRVIIGGTFTSYNGTNAVNIARLTANGQLDKTFHTGIGFNGTVYAVAVDASGNVIVGGDFTSYNTTNCNHIARLLSTGALDTAFLPDTGNGLPNFGTDQDVLAVATDSNGNILLGGEFNTVNGSNVNYVVRLLPTGAVDPSFNTGIGPDNYVYSMAVETNNEVLIAGSFENYNLVPRSGIALLTTIGSLDTGFTPGTGADNAIYSTLVEPNGNILIGGQFRSYNGTRRLGVARLLPQGWLDTSFLDTAYNQFAGLPTTYYNDPVPSVFALGVEPSFANLDGNVIIGGAFTQVGGGATRIDVHPRLNLARLLGAPTVNSDRGGIGNSPGNITLVNNGYTVDDIASSLFITLSRTNGSLGPASLTLGTNLLPVGPGAAGPADFSLLNSVATYDDIYPANTPPLVQPQSPAFNAGYGWKMSDAFYGHNYSPDPQPNSYANQDNISLILAIKNDPAALQNLFANLSLLNLNSFDLLNLGGEPTPTLPALGLPGAQLEIINDNFPPGLFGFSVSNYITVNTTKKLVVSVLRTNGSADLAELQYYTKNGTAISNTSTTLNDYAIATGTLVFQPGVVSNGFTVTIENHATAQPTKYFNLYLSNPALNTGNGLTPFTNAFDTNLPPLVSSNAIVTIYDGNFAPGHLCFTSTNFSVLKPGVATVSVQRIGGALGQLTVQCGTIAAPTNSAVNGVNYIGVTNTLSWGTQDVSVKTMNIQTLQDGAVDGNLNVGLVLLNATNVGAIANDSQILNPSDGPITANMVIQESDSYGTINFAAQLSHGVPNFNISQNAGTALVTLIRTSGATGFDTVYYTTAPYTNVVAKSSTPPPGYQPALAGVNYGVTSGSVTFAPGVTSQAFTVPVYFTPAETVITNRVLTLALTNSSGNIAVQFPKYATLTILDPQLILNQAGSVNTTITGGAGFNGYVDSLALQPDGNLLASGGFTFYDQYPYGYVGRLQPNGSYDSSFLFDLAGANSNVYQVLSQSASATQTNSGPVVIVGGFTTVNGINRNGVARLNLNGSLDETFNPGSGADSTVFAVAETLLPTAQANLTNLSFYVGGNFANFNGVASGGIVRLYGSANSPGYPGTVDPTFNVGQGGVASINGAIHAIAVQGDNSIIAGGDFTYFNSIAHNHLVRLNAAGIVDSSFNPGTGVASANSVRAIVIQPDGRILIGGSFTNVTVSNVTYNFNYLARLNHDGSVDPSFQVGAGGNNSVLALAIDSQQRILVGGEFTRFSGVTRSGITRLNPDGTVDPTINFASGADGGFVDSIVIDSDDSIDVGGGFTSFEGTPANNYARLFGGSINSAYGTVGFSQPVYGVLQDGTNAVITLERLGGEADLNVIFSTSNNTAISGIDYTGFSTNINFPAGETFETVLIPIINNEIAGSNKIVNLLLSNPTNAVNPSNSVIGVQASAQLIITNVNTAAAFSAPTYVDSANVPGGYAIIPINRVGNPNSTFTVTVFTGASGTAVPNVNFNPASSVLTFNPGVLVQDFNVPILNAPNVFDDLTVQLNMTNPVNASVVSPSNATLTIANVYTGPGVLSFSQPSYMVSQAATYAVIAISRTNGSSGAISVMLTTSNGTAIAGKNYAAVNATVNFADGETSQTVSIPIIPQSAPGPDTTVYLTLSNPQPTASHGGPVIAGATQEILTLQNKNENFTFGAAAYSVTEGNVLTVPIYRNGPITNTASVSYTTYSPGNANNTNGYAVPNVDYVPTSGSLTFVGNQPQSISITIPQRNVVNGPLTFQVVLNNPSPGSVQIGTPGTTTVTILNDLTVFQFATNAYTVAENQSTIAIGVNRLNTTNPMATVQFATSDGTNANSLMNAKSNVDYIASSGTVTFTNGVTTGGFYVTILNPNILEGNKNFYVTLSNPQVTGGNVGYLSQPITATITITNVLTATTKIVPSPINVTALASSAFLSWTTPIASTAQVAYGLTTNYGSLTALSGPSTNHTILLTGLTRDATYYYQAVSWFNEAPYPQPFSTNGTFSTVDTLILNTGDAYYTGSWLEGSFAVGNYYGSYYEDANSTSQANPTSMARYSPSIPSAGRYNVYEWYPTNSSFTTNAQVYVFGATNTIIVNLDQTTHITSGGQNWQPLVTNIYFASGTNGDVVIYNNTGESNKLVIANAMKWAYVNSQDYPPTGSGVIPGWWSSFYGNTPAANTNYADYVFGVSPNDSSSPLVFGATPVSNNGVMAYFTPNMGGRVYRLQSTASLSNPQWVTLTNLPTVANTAFTNTVGIFTNGTGYGVFNVTLPNASQLFYRLSAQLGTNY